MASAVDLLKCLAESGTGESKLAVIRNLIADNPEATAERGVKALEDASKLERSPIALVTLDKARKFAAPKT